MNAVSKIRLAIIVSHPIQYWVPLYRRLSRRDTIQIKVFYTWHAAESPKHDPGFGHEFKWDIPLTDGYEYEVVPNTSRDPGTHHFFGLRNPDLIRRVTNWKADAAYITGYAYAAHLHAIQALNARRVPVIFRGDSHLLNEDKSGIRWVAKRFFLTQVYKRTTACFYVGKRNYEYFRTFNVPKEKLYYCPPCVDVERFSKPDAELERKAAEWRAALKIPIGTTVLLFAGKFQAQKQPVELMEAVADLGRKDVILIMVGDGELESRVQEIASLEPERFRVLPFQNQTMMPIVYRLGDIFMLASQSETWGLGANEALACGRRVLLSDRVGCAPDVVTSPDVGEVFATFDKADMQRAIAGLLDREPNRTAIDQVAMRFDVSVSESTLCDSIHQVLSGFSGRAPAQP